jgi:iron(III) transport system substrate-binding protein
MIQRQPARQSVTRLLLLLVLLQCQLGIAASAEHEPLIEAARKEGRLMLYAGMDIDEARLLTSEFAKKYRFIQAEIFRASGEKIQQRFLVEQRAGVHSADVFQASIVQVYQLKNLQLLEHYVPSEATAFRDGYKDSQGRWTALYQIPYVIGYSTRLVPPNDIPTSYEDLLRERWKGWIALETEEYQWFYHWMQILGRNKGLDFMRKFVGQNLQMRSGHTLLAQLVAAGEVALATVVYSNRVERMKAVGAPIDWVRFKGPTITAINAIATPVKAPHPNAAKLFINFVLSKEGQTLLRGLRRIPARSDVPPDPPALTQGLNLYPARPEGMIESYNDTVKLFDEIFNKTR